MHKIESIFKQYPKEVILKDGSGVTVRPAQSGDISLLRGLYSRLPETERWFLDVDDTLGDITEIKQSEEMLSTVAVLENRIVSHAILVRFRAECMRHIGKVRITVDPSYRGKNLATWMLLDITNLAMEINLEILVMNLAVATKTPISRGIEKLGFKESALLKGYLKDMDGKPHDLVLMVKRIHLGH